MRRNGSTTPAAAAGATTSSSTTRTAPPTPSSGRQPGHHGDDRRRVGVHLLVPVDGPCGYTSARLADAGEVHPAVRPLRGAHPDPEGQGLWPAFWMLGADIRHRELAGVRRDRHHGEHRRASRRSTTAACTCRRRGPRRPADRHVHAAGRREAGGRLPHLRGRVGARRPSSSTSTTTSTRRRPPPPPPGATWEFDQPFFIILNVAVGGNFPGPPTSSTTFPQTMKVDWVRVYEPTLTAG